ncbi:MAG: helicase associated domain-containing protein, partial [Lachnospiraceae bacterium]|nr:helicase associated domain-containing protein [Lachnospiraceae bacterium]
VDEEGVALGSWIADIRACENAGARQKYLTSERIRKLNDLGMVWDVLDYYWERNYAAAYRYYLENRNLDVPAGYVTEDGIRLGTWITRLRSLRAGTAKGTPPDEDQVKRLDAIGMNWGKQFELKWETGFRAASDYMKEYGNLSVPVKYITENGFGLGTWVQRQRVQYKKGRLSGDRTRRLDQLCENWRLQRTETENDRRKQA